MRLAISVLVIGLDACGAKVPPEDPKPATPVAVNETPQAAEPAEPAVAEREPEPEPTDPSAPPPEEPAPPPEPEPVEVVLHGLAPKDAAAKLQPLTDASNTAGALRGIPMMDAIAIEIFQDACDGKRSACTTKETLTAEAFPKWLDETVIDPPGWATGAVDRCAKGCCTMKSVAAAAAKEGVSPPHGMFQLDKICFVLEAGKTTAVKSLHFTEL